MKWFWRGEDLVSDPLRFRILTAGFGCLAIDDETGEQSGLLADLEAAREWCEHRQNWRSLPPTPKEDDRAAKE